MHNVLKYSIYLLFIRYDGEKYYVFILKVERLNIKDPTYIFRTYK